MKLQEALQACASFRFTNTDSSNAKRVCILPGVYNTMNMITPAGQSKSPFFGFHDKTSLTKAGYNVDEVADDYNSNQDEKVQVNATDMCTFRDFLNAVRTMGLTVTKMTIQNHVSSLAVYDQNIEVCRTSLGSKGGSDFIRLQRYRSVNAYDSSKIEVDLNGNELNLDASIFMAMTIPASADFTITFDFA